ncbi:MAG: hypothetical protein WCG26_05900, partial [Chloroflexales bacterium]
MNAPLVEHQQRNHGDGKQRAQGKEGQPWALGEQVAKGLPLEGVEVARGLGVRSQVGPDVLVRGAEEEFCV